MIVCAAIRFIYSVGDDSESMVICGRRHGDIFKIWANIKPEIRNNKIQEVQGFIDDKCNFLDRIAAHKHFIETNQGDRKSVV